MRLNIATSHGWQSEVRDIDFGLALLAEMLDERSARVTQLMLEYDPDLPVDHGSPRSASEDEIQEVREYVAPLNAEVAAMRRAQAGRRAWGTCGDQIPTNDGYLPTVDAASHPAR